MPKLLRGSSLSREDKGSAEGAGTAADCTERAGESPLELVLESLEQEKNTSLEVKVFVRLVETASVTTTIQARCEKVVPSVQNVIDCWHLLSS